MKIGLSKTENPAKHVFYVNWLRGIDDIEVMTLEPGTHDPAEIEGYDALVLSGGLDIHPQYYKGRNDYPDQPSQGWDEQRDAFEFGLFSKALDHSIPILGICRGLQLINVALKGNLVQALVGDFKNSHVGNPDKLHKIDIIPNTTLHRFTGVPGSEVNSAHHQVVDRLGEGLRVSAKSADGLVEAIEWDNPANKPLLLAVQWHPERMFKFGLEHTPASETLRAQFIEEIKRLKK